MTAAAREQIDTDHDEEAADAESGRLTIAALRAELAATTANLRSEAGRACDLRVAQDQVIERCAQAVQAEWPDAAKTLRAHVDGISGEDWGELQRELAAERAAHTDLRKQILTFSKGICAALGITDGGITGPNEPIAAIERMKAELDALSERCRTIADEATGPHPVMSAEDALTHIEKELFDLRVGGNEARANVARVCAVLVENGCDCECDHHPEEHDDDCERCLACHVQSALDSITHGDAHE